MAAKKNPRQTKKSTPTYGIETSYGGKKAGLGYAMSKLDKAEAKAAKKKSRVETRAAKAAYREASSPSKAIRGRSSSSQGGSYTTTPNNKYVYKGSYKTAQEAPRYSRGVRLNPEQSRTTKVEYTKELSPKLRKAKKELASDIRFDRDTLGVTKQSKKVRNIHAKEAAARTLGLTAKAERLGKKGTRVSNRPGNAKIRQADRAYGASGMGQTIPGYGQGNKVTTADMQKSCPSSSGKKGCGAITRDTDPQKAAKTRFERRENRQAARTVRKIAKKTNTSGAGDVLAKAAGKVSRKLGSKVKKVQNKKIAKGNKKYEAVMGKVKGSSALITGNSSTGQ